MKYLRSGVVFFGALYCIHFSVGATQSQMLTGRHPEATTPGKLSAKYTVTFRNESDHIDAVLRRTAHNCMNEFGPGEIALQAMSSSAPYVLEDSNNLFHGCTDSAKTVTWQLIDETGVILDEITFNHYKVVAMPGAPWETEITTKYHNVKAWCDGGDICSDNGPHFHTASIVMEALYPDKFQLAPITILSPASNARFLDTAQIEIWGTGEPGQTIVSSRDGDVVKINDGGDWKNPRSFYALPGAYSVDAAYLINGRRIKAVSRSFSVEKSVVIDSPSGSGQTFSPENTIDISGRAAPHSMLNYTISDSHQFGIIPVKPDGTWSYKNTDGEFYENFPGKHTFTVTQSLSGYSDSRASIDFNTPIEQPIKIIEPMDMSIHDADYTFIPAGKGEPGAQVEYSVYTLLPASRGRSGTDVKYPVQRAPGSDCPEPVPVDSRGDWLGCSLTLSKPGQYFITATQSKKGIKLSEDTSRFIVDTEMKITEPANNAWLDDSDPVIIKGTGQPRKSIDCFLDDSRVTGTNVDGAGNWQCQITFDSGKHVVSAKNKEGNGSERTYFAARPLTVIPGADSWLSGPVTLKGTKDSRATVQYILNDNPPVEAAIAGGTDWQTAPLSLTPGRYTLSVYYLLENEKGPAIKRTFYVAHLPAITTPTNNQTILTHAFYAITGTGEPGATVDVSLMDGWYPIDSTTVTDDGQWSVQGPPSGTGTYQLTVSQHRSGFDIGHVAQVVTVLEQTATKSISQHTRVK